MNIELERVEDFEIVEGRGLKGKINGTKYYAGNLKYIDQIGIKYDVNLIDNLTS